MKCRYLITGGAGFIGSAMVRHIIGTTDHQVLVVDKLTYAGNRDNLAPIARDSRFTFMQADICDERAMCDAFVSFQPTHVIHLAAESHVDRSIDSPRAFIDSNVVGTFTLLETARAYWRELEPGAKRQFRFIHASTDEVFGSLGEQGTFSEASPYDPSSPYSASKAASDHFARAWHHTYGLPVIVSNCSNNYGPHQFPEKLIPLAILNALEGRPIPVYGRGDQIRDWLHVEDHARALHLIADQGRPGESYVVGGDSERSNLEVVRSICSILDALAPAPGLDSRQQLIGFVSDRPGHDQRYAMDASKLRGQLGWAPREDFESGLRNTVVWYLNNENWWRPLRTAYRGERLGAGA